ncbi:MAG: DUF2892 domain-containing protein [Verrucomicrobia bacterium]|nr:DUF2892 domain-containing protein [Verrucomicrobiota bacterium]MBV9657650.1 DUF2892 domain-containing protein [Verrucomicrobiota bacterium]
MSLLNQNLDRGGRVARLFAGFVILLAALLLFLQEFPVWVVALAAFGGAFCIFQALTGWCWLRALGIRTWC